MDKLKYPHLFTPITLGNTFFRNRIFASPIGFQYHDANHFPTQRMRQTTLKRSSHVASVRAR